MKGGSCVRVISGVSHAVSREAGTHAGQYLGGGSEGHEGDAGRLPRARDGRRP
jgi:hypothetical protein